MRVSFLLSQFGRTGGSMNLYYFMDQLCRAGLEVFAVTPTTAVKWRPGETARLITSFRETAPLWRTYVRALLRRNLIVWGLARRLAGKDILAQLQRVTLGLLRHWVESEVTITTYTLTAYAGLELAAKTKVFSYLQHLEHVLFDDPMARSISRATYYMPWEILVNSNWLRLALRQETGRDPCVITPGVDQRVFYPRQSLQKYRQREWKVVSYYSPRPFKAWPEAVRAMELVFRRVGTERVRWIVFGGRPPVRPRVPVRFTGELYGEDLARLYSEAHVVFMNSWYESFPLPPIEAMACGTAVVTTRFGTEDYAKDGYNALVVEPQRPGLVAEAICELIERPSLAEEIASRAVDSVKAFDWKVSGTKLLERVLGGRQWR